MRVLRGDDPWPEPRARREPRVEVAAAAAVGTKPWAFGVLGVASDASPDDIKRAFRALALSTHPDRGGDPAAFIDAKRALDVALATDRRRRRTR